MDRTIIIDGKTPLSISCIEDLVRNPKTRVSLSTNKAFLKRLQDSRKFLLDSINSGIDVYGATTGFGASSNNRLAPEESEELQENLLLYHRCGVGDPLSFEHSLAVLLIRTHCLAKGYSAVSISMLEHMVTLLNHRLAPIIPSMGSVGASGDLTPLAYVGGLLQAEGKAYYQGEVKDAAFLFKDLNLKAYAFKAREGLALVNGTAVMTAISVCTLTKIKRFSDLSCSLTALLVELMQGRSSSFAPELHAVKAHKGQGEAASHILSFLNNSDQRLHDGASPEHRYHHDSGIQDQYSIRCSPHVIGVLIDTLAWAQEWIAEEMNGVSDNPIVDVENELVLNGGHFFGGHVAAASDSLKTAIANVVNLMDRQMALLLGSKVEQFLSQNLVADEILKEKSGLHHGFKAVQISISALAAEIQKNSIPMGIFSRPTESGNQDVVSMGTIAARDLDKILAMAMDCTSMLAMALRQGFFVAESKGYKISLSKKAKEFLGSIQDSFEPVIKDRALDIDIENTKQSLFGA